MTWQPLTDDDLSDEWRRMADALARTVTDTNAAQVTVTPSTSDGDLLGHFTVARIPVFAEAHVWVGFGFDHPTGEVRIGVRDEAPTPPRKPGPQPGPRPRPDRPMA